MLERLGARVDVIDFPKMTNSQDLNLSLIHISEPTRH